MVVDMVFVLVLVDKVHTANMEMVTIDRIIASIADSDIIADVDILVSHINIEGVVVIRLVRYGLRTVHWTGPLEQTRV